jgi:hypothetical protein
VQLSYRDKMVHQIANSIVPSSFRALPFGVEYRR